MSIYSIISDIKFSYLNKLVSAKFLQYKGIIFAFVFNKYLWGDPLKRCQYFLFVHLVVLSFS